MDDMGDGCLPGKNSLTLIVKGGERAIEGEEGREDRRVDFMMQGLDLCVPVWCYVYVCVSRFEDAVRVIHMGVVSAAGVIFLFAAYSACPCSLSKCVCVCVGQAGGRVWCSCIIIHPPFPPSP